MLVGYARVSKADGSQSIDFQQDALIKAGVQPEYIYHDLASGKLDERQGLQHCLKVLRKGDVLIIWKLDRLGRNLQHLVVRPVAPLQPGKSWSCTPTRAPGAEIGRAHV